ncbi:hypothetical protein BG011_007699 [Mortierella polycephala]|uniref:Uncharacterized protein n=1 Tax=Mortierella polycephala TaxID=41804 RepID=A0A9P6QEV6_9FUNG|nr:hypothetical protein BG011_007699 [Mortierella polycephala]
MIWNNNENKSQSTNEVFLSGLCSDDNYSRWIKTNAFNMKLRREMNHNIIIWTGSTYKRATSGQGLQAQADIIIAVFAHLDMGSIGHKIRIRTSRLMESATRTNSIGNHFFRALSSSEYPPPTIIVQFVEPCTDYGGALRNHEEFRVVAQSLNMPIVEVCSLMPVLNAMCCAIENPAELWKLAQIPVVRHLWRGMSLRSVDSAFARPVRTNDIAPMQQQQQALMQVQDVSSSLDMMARRRFGHTGLSQGSMPYQTLDRSSPSTVDDALRIDDSDLEVTGAKNG